ncbi:MAG TPA: M91 family zinc metallopeptidase [Chitinophagaceae bacterium]|nr:M91 family zinc metallopeptidase [Chitinophagaceae bacterium]
MAPTDIVLGRNTVANRDLTKAEVRELMAGLQSKTDDKLSYNEKTHQVEIAKSGSGKKTKGTELIRKLIGHDKTLTINMAKNGEEAMPGAATGASNESLQKNASNGVGIDAEMDIGMGHLIFTQDKNGKVIEQRLTTGDMLDHELVHAIAQMNGEAREGGKGLISYTDNKGVPQTERVPMEEVLTIDAGRAPSKSRSMPGYQYPTENTLRREQGKGKRLNYLDTYQIK